MSTPSQPLPSLGRQPSLDGIRGIAVLAVLAFHFEWLWLPGGFLGVDVFFTLSGFLITTLLLEEHFETDRISLGRFFARRGIRLYPALVALVGVSTAFTLLFHRDTPIERTVAIALSVLSYSANWATMLDTSGWFGGMPHTWSLAIEVHFYLLWAVIVFLVARRFGQADRRPKLLTTLAVIAGAIALVSAAWRGVLATENVPWLRMYLGTDTRLDAVFIGTLSALLRLHALSTGGAHWLVSAGRPVIAVLELLCAATLILLLALTPWRAVLPGMFQFTLVSLATAGLILTSTCRAGTLAGGILSSAILTWFGRISYSLYIWHVPAAKLVSSQRLISAGVPPLVAELIRFGITIVIGLISYHLIERTFLRLKRRFEPVSSVHQPVATAA